MVMEQILCIYCGDLFDPSPRHKGRTSCKKPECKRAKKADWQRHKMQTDPIYRSNQKVSQKEWARANPGYWRQYRRRNPEKAERNRILQAIRNRKARSSHPVAKMDAIGKMDASKSNNFKTSSGATVERTGSCWMVVGTM